MKRPLALLCLAFTGIAFAQREPLPSEPPESVKSDLDLTYGKAAEQDLKLDIYRPKGGAVLPGCVLVHGGGWMKGDKEKFRPLAIALAERGYVVANVEYRLGGAAKYPAGVQDCLLAVRWLRSNSARFGVDPDRIGAWGGSAGGHIVGMMAGSLPAERFITGDLRDVSPALQASCIMAGPTDLTSDAFVANLRKAGKQSNSFQWLGRLYDDDPGLYREASPLTHFTKDTGPVLFLTGNLDNPDRDEAGLEVLKSLGVATKQVLIADGKHGCWMQRPWFEKCVDAVDVWFKEHLQ